MFDYEGIIARAENTPARVVFLSPFTIHLLLSALANAHEMWMWSEEIEELSQAEREDIEDRVSMAEHEIMTSAAGLENGDETMKLQARYKGNTGQVLANITNTRLNYNTRDYDTHNAIVTGADWLFTAPQAGFYHVTASAQFTLAAWSGSKSVELRLGVNGAILNNLASMTWDVPAGALLFLSGGDDVYLHQGDTLSIIFANASGGDVTIGTSSNGNHVSIAQVA